MALREIIIKRATALNVYDTLYPKTTIAQVIDLTNALLNKVETSLIGAPSGLATLDGAGKVPETQLPASVFGGMRYVGAMGLDTSTGALDTLIDTFIVNNGGTKIGCYFIATTAITITVTINSVIRYNDDDGAVVGSTVVLEPGDWILYDSFIDPDSYWSVVNNTYRDATPTNKGIVKLSSTSAYGLLAGNDVITEGVLKTVIDQAGFSVDGHNHDADYLAIGGTAVLASQAVKLQTARSISLGGDLSGSAVFDGSANITITASVGDNSHAHFGAGLSTQQSGDYFSVGTIDNVLGEFDAEFLSRPVMFYQDTEAGVLGEKVGDILFEW